MELDRSLAYLGWVKPSMGQGHHGPAFSIGASKYILLSLFGLRLAITVVKLYNTYPKVTTLI